MSRGKFCGRWILLNNNYILTFKFKIWANIFYRDDKNCIPRVQTAFWGKLFVWKKTYKPFFWTLSECWGNKFLQGCRNCYKLMQRSFLRRIFDKIYNLIFVFKQTNFIQSFSGMSVKSAFYMSLGKNCGRCLHLKKFLMLHLCSKFEQKNLAWLPNCVVWFRRIWWGKPFVLKDVLLAVFEVWAKSLLTYDKHFRHCWQNCYKHVQMKLLRIFFENMWLRICVKTNRKNFGVWRNFLQRLSKLQSIITVEFLQFFSS